MEIANSIQAVLAPEDVKYKKIKGISMNQYNYLKEYIQKRVMPFIRQYHADNNYIFWPDQAKAHYAKNVINYLNENNLNFVHKNDYLVNLP